MCVARQSGEACVYEGWKEWQARIIGQLLPWTLSTPRRFTGCITAATQECPGEDKRVTAMIVLDAAVCAENSINPVHLASFL